MDRQMIGWTNGWTNEWTNGWTDEWTDEWTNGQTGGRTEIVKVKCRRKSKRILTHLMPFIIPLSGLLVST